MMFMKLSNRPTGNHAGKEKDMRTAEGKYNEEKVATLYELCKTKLNSHELALLTDKLVIDRHVLIKTALLVRMDMETI